MKVKTFAALLFVPLTIATIVICFSNGTGIGQEPQSNKTSAAETTYTVWMWDHKEAPQWQPMLTVVGFGMVMQKVSALNALNRPNAKVYTFTNGDQPLLRPDGAPVSLRVAANPLPPGIETSPRATPVRRIPPVASQRIVRNSEKKQLSRKRRPLKEARPPHGKVTKLYHVTHDFGIKPPNSTGKYVFTFENGGKKPLVLELADKSCGCTGVKLNGQEMKTAFDQPLDDLLQPIPMDANELPEFGESESLEPKQGIEGELPELELTLEPEGADTIQSSKQPADNKQPSQPAIPEFDPVELNKLLESAEQNAERSIETEAKPDHSSDSPSAANSISIAPGEEARLEIDWKVSDLSGPFSQSITLKTSDPKRKKLAFRIRGQVAADFEASVDLIELDDAPVGKPTRKTIRVFSRLHDDFRLAAVSSSNPAVQVHYRPLAISPSESAKIRSAYEVTLRVPANQPIGAIESVLTLQPANEDFAPLTIPVTGFVRGAITIHPTDVIEFPVTRSGQSTTEGVYLKIKTDAAVKFTRATADPSFLKVSVKHWNDIKEGIQYAIVEAVVPSDAPAGEFAGIIELEVSDPVNQRIRIPVYGLIVE